MTARPPTTRRRRAMTIVEVVLAMFLMTMVLGGIMSAAAMSGRVQYGTADSLLARTLAADLVEHVCALPYADPVDASEVGLGADEIAADRATFDDVDDFHGWSESPPVRPDGVPIPGAAAWTRTVTVGWVDPLSPNAASGSETGAKLVTVTVERAGIPLAVISRLRTAAMDAAGG